MTMRSKLEELVEKYRSLGIDAQLDYDKFYLYSIITNSTATYSIKGNDLIIGSLNMGTIKFTSDNEFTLDYKKSVSNSSDYRRYIYTYTRIYSLTL